ncbi:CRTAC1 family protein [Catenovulum maritimum]|uniref:CRTAC1 family protein n=1 Tax=Catenovulum maritimum TaxID=1513271 RepID=UPI0006603099|nr:CRTAC1 family protein [Catenovulum maritimum]
MKNNQLKLSAAALICSSLLTGCQSTQVADEANEVKANQLFAEATKNFPREEKNLRQWDAPVVADLDQDGYPDLLLNDHGFAIRVLWNNKGTYTKPYDLIMGDMHGISAGDFDFDGKIEVIISRGGGSGSNARNSIIYRVDTNRQFSVVEDFTPPLAFMRGRTVKFFDGDSDGDLDLINFAFPSKEMKGQSENYVYENKGNRELVIDNTLPPVKGDGQKTLLTDFNNDGVEDMLIYGNGPVKAYQGKGDLTFVDVTSDIFTTKLTHVTAIAEVDYDNDGDFDLFFTRGKEFTAGQSFYNADTKIWGYYTKRGAFNFEGIEAGDILNIENLQSQWPNKDLYLGESAYSYEFPGETHSGRDVRLVNSDTLGFPDKLDKKGTYIGYVGNRQWRIAGNIWSPSTGVIHNVDAGPVSESDPGLTDLLLRNNQGKFTDVSQQLNLTLAEHSTGLAIADVDNNGYQDLIITKRGNLVDQNEPIVYLNQQAKGFTQIKQHGILSTELGVIGMGIEPLDYNLDGKVDFVLGNERGKWHLFENTNQAAEANHFITVQLGSGLTTQVTALGALVKVTACGNTQTKRLGSTGANYSLSFDPNLHFGLGQCTEPASINVTWTNNETYQTQITEFNKVIKIGK